MLLPIFVRSLSAHSSECVFSMFNGLSSANAPAQKRATAVIMVVNFILAVLLLSMCSMCKEKMLRT